MSTSGSGYILTSLIFKSTLTDFSISWVGKRCVRSWKEALHVFAEGREYSTLCVLTDYLSSCTFHSNFTDYKALSRKFTCEK